MNRKYALSSLFFVYFAVYAMSPLSYAGIGEKAAQNSLAPGRMSVSEKDIRIFFWESVFAKFFPKEDAPHTPSDIKLLIKKARAIVPENTIARLICFEDTLMPGNCRYLVCGAKFKTSGSRRANRTKEGFYPCYSAHSPPSA